MPVEEPTRGSGEGGASGRSGPLAALAGAFNDHLTLRHFFALDFRIAFAVGALVYIWALIVDDYAALGSVNGLLIGVVGVVLGASVSALALLTAFFDTRLLNDLAASGLSPVKYLVPFLATICLGLVAEVLLVVALLAQEANAVAGVVVSGAAIFFSVWSILSILFSLDALLQFLRIKQLSAEE